MLVHLLTALVKSDLRVDETGGLGTVQKFLGGEETEEGGGVSNFPFS